MLQRMRRRRARKKALHASLNNPKDLFWDAVWIQPEDIIREVNLKTKPHAAACLCIATTTGRQLVYYIFARVSKLQGRAHKHRAATTSVWSFLCFAMLHAHVHSKPVCLHLDVAVGLPLQAPCKATKHNLLMLSCLCGTASFTAAL